MPRHTLMQSTAMVATLITSVLATGAQAQSPCAAASSPCIAVSSDPLTFRFGVQADWPDSLRIGPGHADWGFRYMGCGVFENYANGALEAEPFDTSASHYYIGAASSSTPPSIPSAFAFTGAQGGQPFWRGPQEAETGKLFLGTNSERTNPGIAELAAWNPNNSAANRTTFDVYAAYELLSVTDENGSSAPGFFSIWQTGSFGSRVWASSFDPQATVANNQMIEFFPGHSHHNWGFTAPGLYAVTVRAHTYIEALPIFDLNADNLIDSGDITAWQAAPENLNCDQFTDFFDAAWLINAADEILHQ